MIFFIFISGGGGGAKGESEGARISVQILNKNFWGVGWGVWSKCIFLLCI